MSGSRKVWWFEDGIPRGGWRPVVDDPEFDLEPEPSTDWLAEALETLTPKQRFVLERSWGINGFEQYSFRQIGEFMGVSWQVVQRHSNAAMTKLRAQGVPQNTIWMEDEYA